MTYTQHNNALQCADCVYSECRILFIVMLSIAILNVIILSDVMVNVVMLCAVAPCQQVLSYRHIMLSRCHIIVTLSHYCHIVTLLSYCHKKFYLE
jgi:hypothetical protein